MYDFLRIRQHAGPTVVEDKFEKGCQRWGRRDHDSEA